MNRSDSLLQISSYKIKTPSKKVRESGLDSPCLHPTDMNCPGNLMYTYTIFKEKN